MDDWFANAELVLADYRAAGNSSYDALLDQGSNIDKLTWLTRFVGALLGSQKRGRHMREA